MEAAATAPQQHPMRPTIPQSDVILPDTKLRETSRFVFFAGDHITPSEKYANPTRSMGGVELDMYLTLKETGKELYARPEVYNTGGVLYRCAIHQLKTAYLPVNKEMILPANRDGSNGMYVPGYVKRNGRRNHETGQYEDVAVTSTNLMYRPFYPGDEIEPLTRQSTGLRPGGIVEITALEGKGQDEQIAAQLHYFPNWEALQTGAESFPATLRELRGNIEARLAAADTEYMRSIGRDMLRSCDEYRLWGMRYLKAWRQTVKFADTQIDSPIAGYNELAEMLFEMLGVAREDTLNQADNVSNIAAQIGQSIAAAIAQGMSPQQAAQQVDIPMRPVDPMAGIVAAEEPPGEMLPEEPVVEAVATAVETPSETAEPETSDAVIKVGNKVLVMIDGIEREGLVTAKPFGKLKLAFEDGSTATVEKDAVIGVV